MELYAKINVAMPRDPRMIAAGPVARMLYVQCVLYCRENLTDGCIDRLVLPIVAVDITSPAKHMARLTELGALDATPEGWVIPVDKWTKYNPLRIEVEAIVAAKGEAGALGNHRRWHRTEPSPDCRYCIAEPSQNGSHKDRKVR